MEKELNVNEIYQCLGLLSGFSQTNEKGEIVNKILGFVNEKTISEGMRRIANKTLKKLKENYPDEQIKQIQSLSFKDLYDEGKFPEDYKETEDDNKKLATLKSSKLDELINNKVNISFEELPDFKTLDNRLEERKEKLSADYTFLFEKLFLNY